MENKKLLNKAFSQLRKLGFFARQNFWCCQNCGWSDIPSEKRNVVFYHKQDMDCLKETGICFLSHRGDGTKIVEVLKEHGIGVEWDGSNLTRIKINLNQI